MLRTEASDSIGQTAPAFSVENSVDPQVCSESVSLLATSFIGTLRPVMAESPGIVTDRPI